MKQAAYLVASLRPRQWTKNLLVFAALVFALRLDSTRDVLLATAAFGLFCAASGGLYLLNDLLDLEADRKHPLKRLRPLAAGKLSPTVAASASVVLVAGSLLCSLAFNHYFAGTFLAYIALVLLYNLGAKHLPVVEFLLVALGFLLRAVAGATVILVSISSWFLLCAFFLSLLLVLGKRRAELAELDQAADHRQALLHYSLPLLDQFITIAATGSVMTYCLYTIAPQTVAKFGSTKLEFTIPFVLFGVFRYLLIMYTSDKAGTPEEVLLTDFPTLLNLVLFLATAVALLYLT